MNCFSPNRSVKSARIILGVMAATLFALNAAVAAPASDPSAQALQVYKAFKAQDWSKLYDLSAFSAKVPRNEKGRKNFMSALDKGFSSNLKEKAFIDGISNIATGKASISGNKATVPTSAKCTLNRTTLFLLNGKVDLIKQGGVWKWDLTSDDKNQIKQATKDLFGEMEPVSRKHK